MNSTICPTVQLVRQVAQKVTHRGFFFTLFDDVDNRIHDEVQDFPVQLFQHLVQPQSLVCVCEGCQEDVACDIFIEVASGISPVHLHQVLANDIPVQDFFVGAAENPQKFRFLGNDLALPLIFSLAKLSPVAEIITCKKLAISYDI